MIKSRWASLTVFTLQVNQFVLFMWAFPTSNIRSNLRAGVFLSTSEAWREYILGFLNTNRKSTPEDRSQDSQMK